MFEDVAEIEKCRKLPIDWWTRYLCYPVSVRLVSLIKSGPVTPNQLTLLSLVFVLAGCVWLAMAGMSARVGVALLWYVGYVIDCADGQLARYARKFSPIGGWLDQTTDRIQEFAIFLSLTWVAMGTAPFAWLLGFGAMFVVFMLEYSGQQSCRLPELAPADPSPAQSNKGFRAFRARHVFFTFSIGEQYFILCVGLLFLPPVWVMALVFATTGLKVVIRPFRQLRALARTAAPGQG